MAILMHEAIHSLKIKVPTMVAAQSDADHEQQSKPNN